MTVKSNYVIAIIATLSDWLKIREDKVDKRQKAYAVSVRLSMA